MKLQFHASLPYQQEAIQAAVGVFEVSFTTQMDMLEQTELGIWSDGRQDGVNRDGTYGDDIQGIKHRNHGWTRMILG